VLAVEAVVLEPLRERMEGADPLPVAGVKVLFCRRLVWQPAFQAANAILQADIGVPAGVPKPL